MRSIKKFIAIISSVLGGCLGIILFGLINVAFNIQLSFSTVFIFGLLGGIVLGNAIGFYMAYLLVKKARRYFSNAVSGVMNRFVAFRR